MSAAAPPRSCSLGDLARAHATARLAGSPAALVERIAYDVREVRAGDLYAALDGDPFRGHDHAAEAVARGATALLLSRPLE